MADAACNFALNTRYNAKYDITWSFQYSLCGAPGATGGFTTFLYDAYTPALTGGGMRSGLAFAPQNLTSNLLISPNTFQLQIAKPEFGGYLQVSDGVTSVGYQSGLSGAVVGVGFDSTGLFGTNRSGITTGTPSPIPNTYTVRVGQSFTYRGGGVVPFDVLDTAEIYRTIRINLTNLGQTLNVSYRDHGTDTYKSICSVETGLLFVDDTMCKIGFSYASPVSASTQAVIKFKDIHSQGVLPK